jgi:hypothetical protein
VITLRHWHLVYLCPTPRALASQSIRAAPACVRGEIGLPTGNELDSPTEVLSHSFVPADRLAGPGWLAAMQPRSHRRWRAVGRESRSRLPHKVSKEGCSLSAAACRGSMAYNFGIGPDSTFGQFVCTSRKRWAGTCVSSSTVTSGSPVPRALPHCVRTLRVQPATRPPTLEPSPSWLCS